MSNIKVSIGEQSNGDLILPNNDIITLEERTKIVNSSLETPIRQDEDKIKDIISNNTSAILIGETGSGKTTEFPQMIHELYPNDIIITNIPLVAATIGTASYVSKILYCKTANPYYILGNGGVGYRTGKGVSEQNRTQIGFHTYGLDYLNVSLGNFERFLNSSDKNIHIILDEIHEKSEDFLFYLPRISELRKKYPTRVKFYGASATISDNYLDKLLDDKRGLGNNTPVIRVDGRTFPIDDIIDTGANQVQKAVELYKQGKSILIFEPGKGEIKKVIEALKKELGDNIIIQEIHSQVSREQLNLVLSLEGVQKIFVATNAARTGITLDINSVVDSGLQKMQYYNEFGIPILLKEGISFDAYMQNRGRAGRKENGVAIYTGKDNIEDLDLESKSSVEIKVDEKKILTEILNGVKVSDFKNRLLFKPNKEMLDLSLNRMKQVGLLTKNNKITTIGFEVLKFPISVFNGRILVEAMELGIVDRLISYVSILEERGFITKKFNIKKFKQNFFDKDFSDLEIQQKIFDIFYSENLEDNVLGYLSGLGIDRSKLDIFKYSKKLLIDILDDDDFNLIGLNKKNILSINDKILKIKRTISKYDGDINKNLSLPEKDIRELISKAILSGNIFNLYEAKSTTKFLTFYDETGNDLEFEKSDTSYIDIYPGSIYTGETFIIGGEQDDKNIFSLITRVEQGDISYFEKKKYKEYKKSNKEKITDFSVDFQGDTFVVPKYLQDLDKQKKYLAVNWLPYFLLRKNEFFIKYKDDYKVKFGFFDEDTFVRLLGKITLKIYSKLSLDKQENIKLFTNDDSLLNAFLSSSDEEIMKFKSGEKQEKEILKIDITNEENIVLKYIKKIREYNKVLVDAQAYINKTKINLDSITKDEVGKLIKLFESESTAYSKLIIFLKNNENKGIKSIFSDYEKLNKEYKIILQNIDWLEGFINGLEKIKTREKTSLLLEIESKENKKRTFELLDLNEINSKELLLSDPLIKNLGISDDVILLQKEFKKIKKSLSKLELYSSDLVSLFINFLYIDKRKYSRASKKIDNFLNSLKSKIEKEKEERDNIKLNKNLNAEQRNKEIKLKNKKIKDLYILKKEISSFIDNLVSIRGKIEILEFKDLLLTSNLDVGSQNNFRTKNKKVKNKKTRNSLKRSSIYNRKFLYNIIIDGIFSGELIESSNDVFEKKLVSRVSKIVKGKLSNDEIEELIEILKVYSNTLYQNNSSEKLSEYISKFKSILSGFYTEKEKFTKKIDSEKFNKIKEILISLEEMLALVFTKEKINININKIYNFAKKFSSYSVKNFDNKLEQLLLSMGIFRKNIIINDKAKKLEEYVDLFDELNSFTKENDKIGEEDLFDEVLIQEKLEELDSKIELIKNKTIRLKNITEEYKKIA